MFEARGKRVRPHLDDKVLASWNGMMLGALARAYAVLGDENYRAAAEKNLAFLRDKLWDAASKTLYHRWRQGERDSVQLLTAYANLLRRHARSLRSHAGAEASGFRRGAGGNDAGQVL